MMDGPAAAEEKMGVWPWHGWSCCSSGEGTVAEGGDPMELENQIWSWE